MKKTSALALALALIISLLTVTSCNIFTKEAVFIPIQNGNAFALAFHNDHTITEYVIPETNGGKPVTEIGLGAFIAFSLEKITISKNITAINSMAFFECQNLKEVIIAEGSHLQSIGTYAFASCPSLERINLPEGLIKIDSTAFAACTSLEKINLPESLTTIGTQAFEYCLSLREVHIPANVSTINPLAFNDCPSIERFTVDESNPYFDEIDGNLYTEGGSTLIRYAPANPNTSFTLPNQTVEIEADAFSDCVNLENIYVEEGNEEFVSDNGILYSTMESVFLVFEDLIKYPAGRKDEEFVITKHIIHVNEYAFEDCVYLKKIDLVNKDYEPDSDDFFASIHGVGVDQLQNWSIDSCPALTTVILPGNLSPISFSLFNDCPSLTDIYFGGTMARWQEISKSMTENFNTGKYVVHCSDGDILPE